MPASKRGPDRESFVLRVERPDLLLDVIAPGVYGKRFDTPRGTYYPLVYAARRGAGDVGRFLDALPRDRRVAFPTVASDRLRGMLERRGFRPETERDDDLGDVEVWARGGVDKERNP